MRFGEVLLVHRGVRESSTSVPVRQTEPTLPVPVCFPNDLVTRVRFFPRFAVHVRIGPIEKGVELFFQVPSLEVALPVSIRFWLCIRRCWAAALLALVCVPLQQARRA